MKKASANQWSFHTTYFHLAWTSRTSQTPSDLTAPFCLSDTDRALEFGRFKTESITDSSLDVSRGRIDYLMDQTKEELHTTQGKNCSWARFECCEEWRTQDAAGRSEVAGTPAAATGLKRFFFFAKGAAVCSGFYPWTLVFFCRPFAEGCVGRFLKVIRDWF